ncbi:MAG: N-(5'-phosphoribosyl)anthranilate isomerase [Thermodesulfovibrio sp. RBG_19FT_COMBO_42_12]|nr:MAG: N-(5'-phosphoribosyl)anthranilate isomerase [Thermodesulfovibrio sp. RBG_19FT_COMBO_42_12]
MQIKVKICGITNIDDAVAAVDFGADALGFVFFEKSPRYISHADAAAIIKKLPSFTTTIGVFVNVKPDQVEKIIDLTHIDAVQLHGNEPPEMCNISRRVIKAIRVKSLESLDPLINYKDKVSAFLLDTFTPDVLGGTGQIFNWDIAIYAKQFGKIILAGGLTPDNVAEAVRRVRPYGVDVSSGVESEKGKKDQRKMKLFIERAKGA